MLQARLENGRLITLSTFTRNEINHFRSHVTFYCPTCEEEVIIRAGPYTIPHFAHQQKTICPSAEGGEGTYHEKGKLLLYEWLQRQTKRVSLEHYISVIRQRPDIYLPLKNKQIAIEYQCARIPLDDLKQRSRGYLHSDIHPIWILGANQFKRKGQRHLKIDPFTLRFIHQFNPQGSTQLYYFCPNTLQFMIASDLYLTNRRTALAKFRFLKMDATRFNDLFDNTFFTPLELNQSWTKVKRNFRIGDGKKPRGKELAWRQWLYLKKLSIENLPSAVYLPVSQSFLMTSSLWDWQSRLCLDLIEPLKLGQSFNVSRCFQLLRSHLQSETNFPLITRGSHPIIAYLALLCRLNIIERVSNTQYKKTTSFHFHKNIEKAIMGDTQIMNKLNSHKLNKF